MLTRLLALTLLATPAVAGAVAQPSRAPAATVADDGSGCMVHAAADDSTALSITATPGEDALLFVIQNEQLGALSDGQAYAIDVEFDNLGPWTIEAVAQADLDEDGPGVVFAVRPGRSDGQTFIKEFASAHAMRIGREGARLDTLAVGGGEGAMASLAQCLGQKWSGSPDDEGQGGPVDDDDPGPDAATPV